MTSDLDRFDVFPWNENFDTGISTIDAQHKRLVALLNELARTLIGGESVEVNSAFGELAAYAAEHFAMEEVIWGKHFPADASRLSDHLRTHASFLPKVSELKEEGTGRPLTATVERIVKFLIRWLAFHIIDVDKRMAIVVSTVESGASFEEAERVAEERMSGSMRVLIEAILTMYDGLSSTAIELLRERHARLKAENKLKEANRRLEELSITDQLTGLFNRRHLDDVVALELRKAIRYKTELTFVLLDVDFFKPYNDHYGHLAGDEVLARTGRALKEACRRPGDIAFRYGGEEFGVLSTHMSDRGAGDFGEILRTAVEKLKIPHEHSDASDYLTVSAGMVNIVPSHGYASKDLLRLADSRLYRAKELGRNTVVAS